MTEPTSPHVRCGSCDAVLHDGLPSDVHAIPPCARCGSVERVIHVFATDHAEVEEHALLNGKDIRRRKGKPIMWFKRGDELHGDTGECATSIDARSRDRQVLRAPRA